MEDFKFVMKVNRASPLLMKACAMNQLVKKAVLVCRKAGKEQHEYLKITLGDVLVSFYQTGGSQDNIVPVDHCSLTFAQIEIEYKEQKADGTLGGTVVAAYDLGLGR
jgi:type VI secretion system secreted protein Hcp